MHEEGLSCEIRKKRYRAFRGEEGVIAPNILKRDFFADAPNKKWVTDVTEFKVAGTKVYLSPMVQFTRWSTFRLSNTIGCMA